MIESAPVPPMTIAPPAPIGIVSPPPIPGAVVSTMPSVIGSAPNGFVSSDAAKIRPLSPRITFVPGAAGDRVVALAADDDRLAGADRDQVVAAVVRRRRRDEVDVRRIGVRARPSDRRSGFSSVPTQVM